MTKQRDEDLVQGTVQTQAIKRHHLDSFRLGSEDLQVFLRV